MPYTPNYWQGNQFVMPPYTPPQPPQLLGPTTPAPGLLSPPPPSGLLGGPGDPGVGPGPSGTGYGPGQAGVIDNPSMRDIMGGLMSVANPAMAFASLLGHMARGRNPTPGELAGFGYDDSDVFGNPPPSGPDVGMYGGPSLDVGAVPGASAAAMAADPDEETFDFDISDFGGGAEDMY